MPSCGRPARAWVLDIHFWGIATLKYFELLAEPVGVIELDTLTETVPEVVWLADNEALFV